MTSIPVDPTQAAPDTPYCTIDDVEHVLGQLWGRLPSWMDPTDYIAPAHATMLDAISKVYPDGIPTFTGPGATVLQWAEAKLTAAEILSAIWLGLSDGEARSTPDELRAEALAAVSDGVPGFPPGSSESSSGGGSGGVVVGSPAPRLSSYTPVSAFPDPYEAVRPVMPGETPSRNV